MSLDEFRRSFNRGFRLLREMNRLWKVSLMRTKVFWEAFRLIGKESRHFIKRLIGLKRMSLLKGFASFLSRRSESVSRVWMRLWGSARRTLRCGSRVER
jgi:hypothetical protein